MNARKHWIAGLVLAWVLTSCIRPDPVIEPQPVPQPEAIPAPQAFDDQATVLAGQDLTLRPLENDLAGEGQALDGSSIDLDPAQDGQQWRVAFEKATFEVDRINASVVVVAKAGVVGTLGLNYTVRNLAGKVSNPARISVTINAVPTPGPVPQPTPQPVPQPTPAPQPSPQTGPLKVLFVGNSRTRNYNLPAQIARLAQKEARAIEAQMVANDGWTLEQHWGNGNGEAVTAIRAGKWDYVVLQELSDRPWNDANAFYAAVRKFVPEVRKVGAKPVLFENWWRKDQSYTQTQLSGRYRNIADELNVGIAPVGSAWLEASGLDAKLELFTSDGNHPTELGSYLAACTFYTYFYEKSAQGLPSLNLPLSASIGNVQAASWTTFGKLETKYRRGGQSVVP